MKIVIVDDDCLVTEALKTILQINGDVEVIATELMEKMRADCTDSIARIYC